MRRCLIDIVFTSLAGAARASNRMMHSHVEKKTWILFWLNVNNVLAHMPCPERERGRRGEKKRRGGATTYKKIHGRKVCLYLLINRKARRQHEITA